MKPIRCYNIFCQTLYIDYILYLYNGKSFEKCTNKTLTSATKREPLFIFLKDNVETQWVFYCFQDSLDIKVFFACYHYRAFFFSFDKLVQIPQQTFLKAYGLIKKINLFGKHSFMAPFGFVSLKMTFHDIVD